MAKIVAVVLAAGAARRFGRPKQLEQWPVGGPTLVERAIANAKASGAEEVLVVTGNAAGEVGAIADIWGCRTVFNPRWADGQGFSVAASTQALTADTEAALFFLSDQPRLQPQTGATLAAAFRQQSEATRERAIIFPTFEGKRGNPVLFGRAHFAALSQLEGDVGGRAVVKANLDCVQELAVNDPAILEDVDTPQDLDKLTAN